jgi:hypothetical protein
MSWVQWRALIWIVVIMAGVLALAVFVLGGCATHRVTGTHYPETQGAGKPFVYSPRPLAN